MSGLNKQSPDRIEVAPEDPGNKRSAPKGALQGESETMDSLPIFSKSADGEVEVLAPTSDGGAQGWAWRDGSWVKGPFGLGWDSMALSRDEVISLIGRAAVESLPEGG